MDVIDSADLTSYLRDDTAEVTLYVELANGIVTDLVGTLVTIPTRVRAITLEVAARAYRNPNGYSSETIDDYTYRRDADTRQAGVYLTAAERAELLGLAGRSTATAYTIGVTSPLDLP